MSNVASLAEVKAAQAFLKAIGASTTDNQLIIAVVSWFRQESGSISRVLGNNPFNIRNDPSAIGYRQTAHNGKFAIFKTLAEGFAAAARLLLRAGNDWRGYGLIVRAARAGRAVDFLNAIAMSAWDVAHYGYDGKNAGTNHLLVVFASFTGLQLPPPPAKHKPKPRALPVRRDLSPPISSNNYIDPYATGSFYRARHRPIKPLG